MKGMQGGFQLMQTLGLLNMYFDAAVVFVTSHFFILIGSGHILWGEGQSKPHILAAVESKPYPSKNLLLLFAPLPQMFRPYDGPGQCTGQQGLLCSQNKERLYVVFSRYYSCKIICYS